MPTRPLLCGTCLSSQSIVSQVSVLSSMAFWSRLSRGERSMTNFPSEPNRPRMSWKTKMKPSWASSAQDTSKHPEAPLTPYGVSGASGCFEVSCAELAQEGFIFVFQDIRGRFGSEGKFVMLRSPRDKRDQKAIDESTDTWDTIDWLLKHVPHNNGRVGMLGVSYPGWLTVMAMLDPHPALKAVSPQASPASMFLGDDFHHNGAFRLSYGFEYVTMMEGSKEFSPFAFDRHDTYSWYLGLGSLAHADERWLHG